VLDHVILGTDRYYSFRIEVCYELPL
jgi:hypothetical protein